MVLIKVFREFNKRKVKYLVAGGVAAILYGSPRLTKDLDLFVDSEEENMQKVVAAFKALRFIPRVPVAMEAFISKENRARWQREKGMLAFTFINPKNPFENVDLLLSAPMSFQKAQEKRKIFRSEGVPIPTVAAEDLILMKKRAGRPQDLQDIEILRVALHVKKSRRKR